MPDSLARNAPVIDDADRRGRYLGRAQLAPGALSRLGGGLDGSDRPGRGQLPVAGTAAKIAWGFQRFVQACRLVVGIHDYDRYLAHMNARHPDKNPLTRAEFYRRCMEARYPGPGRSGRGCPC